MKDRTLLLAGLVDEDDLEKTRQIAVESYETQLEDDRQLVSEKVNFVEEDEIRLIRLIGEQEEEPEWEGSKTLEENSGIAMGGYGPGFAGRPGYGLGMGGNGVSSRYVPSRDEAFGAILGKDYQNSQWAEVQDPRVELFRKIGESNPYAFDGGSSLSEMELPEFDEDFNPILKEDEGINDLSFMTNELDQKRSDFQNKLTSGEYAVEGGIGPGFSAYDGPKEIKNPYEGHEIMERWYLGNKEDLQELDKGSFNRTKDNLNKTKKILDKTDDRSKKKSKELDEMKEQPDLPGELADLDLSTLDQSQGMVPQKINLATANLSLVGEQNGQHVYSIDGDDAMVGISEDVEGWYAQVRDAVMGLVGEGWGESPELAIQEALQHYTGNQQEMPSTLQEEPGSLNEALEGKTQGNAWYYRRTGTPDNGAHVRFREGTPTMHPEAPEEPSSPGHPGLPGWQFYEADHTKQKLDAKMDDILDEGEIDATREILLKLFDKNSVYQESVEEDEDLIEESDEPKNIEFTRGMSNIFSIE